MRKQAVPTETDIADDQLLVVQGPGSGQPEFGVVEPPQPRPDQQREPNDTPDGAASLTAFQPELEYIRQFNHQNALLRRVYDALTGRARPGRQTVELVPGVRKIMPSRLLVETVIIVNAAGAGVAGAIFTVGTRAYTFAVPATSTLVVPLALTIEQGSDLIAPDLRVYLIGWPTAAEGGA